jgi:hypothetical protein
MVIFKKEYMKNLFVFVAIFAFSFIALAENQVPIVNSAAEEARAIPYNERRCRHWQALGLCERARCSELVQQGRCPVRVARQAPEERTCAGWQAIGKCPRQNAREAAVQADSIR